MSTWVAFLRAINVAGHATVKMTDLRRAFEAAGCRNVRTYIQSGNVLFESPARSATGFARRIEARLLDLLGGEVFVMFRPARVLQELVKAAPFGNVRAGADVKLYVAFLLREPGRRPRLPLASPKEGLEVVAVKGLEAFVVSRRIRGRFGFPNLLIEKELGVPATTRNMTTVGKMAELCGSMRGGPEK